MKRFVCGALPLLVLVLSSYSHADSSSGIDFFKGTFEEALELAEQEEKLVFVDVYTTWCGPCKVMSETVFPDQEVGEYFNSRFISYKLDAEDESIDGPRISNAYDVGAYPTLLFLKPDGFEIGRGVAGYDKEGLLGLAEDLLNEQSANTELLAKLEAKYEEGDRDKSLIQEYLYTASLVSAASYGSDSHYESLQKMGKIFDEYIATHVDDVASLINEKDFQLIRSYAARRPKSHPAVALVFDNYDAYSEIVAEFALCYFVLESNYSTVIDLASVGDPSYKDHIALLDTELAQAHAVIAAEDSSNAILKDQITPRARSQYLIGSKDWEGYVAEVNAKMTNAKDDDAKARIMGRAASWLINSGEEKYVEIGNDYATAAYEADKTEPIHVLNYGGVLASAGKLDAAIQVYDEMLATLDPSSPHYNFRNVLERSIERLKGLMDDEQNTESEEEADSESNMEI